MTVCSCYVTYLFQSESTLYTCLNVKELLARSRHHIWSLSDSNWTRTQYHLVRKRTLEEYSRNTRVWLNKWVFICELSSCGFESSYCHLNAVQCLKCQDLHIGHTVVYWNNFESTLWTFTMSGTSLKIESLQSINIIDTYNVTILQNDIATVAAQRHHEDKWICRLKTLAPHYLNSEIGDYAPEMCIFCWSSNEL